MKSDFSPSRRAWNVIMTAVVWAAAVLVIALTVGVIGLVLVRGIPHISWKFLSTTASVLKKTDGILPAILNTLYVIVLTLLIVLPLGVGAAVYLTEYASNRKLIEVIEFTNETLAGIPSIIYGLVGMLVLVPGIRKVFHLADGASLLAAIIVLAIMILPLIMRTAEEALMAVPDSYREGSFGLGAGRLRTVFRIVLPAAGPGILSGVILGIGRIVGETAALIFTAGTMAQIPGLTQSGRTLAIHMYVLSNEGLHKNEANATAVVLLVIVLLINGVSSLIAKRFEAVKE